jgi:hypothetical protein
LDDGEISPPLRLVVSVDRVSARTVANYRPLSLGGMEAGREHSDGRGTTEEVVEAHLNPHLQSALNRRPRRDESGEGLDDRCIV